MGHRKSGDKASVLQKMERRQRRSPSAKLTTSSESYFMSSGGQPDQNLPAAQQPEKAEDVHMGDGVEDRSETNDMDSNAPEEIPLDDLLA